MFSWFFNRSKSTIDRDTLLRGDSHGTHILNEPIEGYKKVKCSVEYKNIGGNIAPKTNDTKPVIEKCIAKLRIPKDATVIRPYTEETEYGVTSTNISNKLRTDTYEILDISPEFYDNKILEKKVIDASSIYSEKFKYEKGKTYKENLDPRENIQCTNGLHFFLKIHEAQAYVG